MVCKFMIEILWYFFLLLMFKDMGEIGHYLTMTKHGKAKMFTNFFAVQTKMKLKFI